MSASASTLTPPLAPCARKNLPSTWRTGALHRRVRPLLQTHLSKEAVPRPGSQGGHPSRPAPPWVPFTSLSYFISCLTFITGWTSVIICIFFKLSSLYRCQERTIKWAIRSVYSTRVQQASRVPLLGEGWVLTPLKVLPADLSTHCETRATPLCGAPTTSGTERGGGWGYTLAGVSLILTTAAGGRVPQLCFTGEETQAQEERQRGSRRAGVCSQSDPAGPGGSDLTPTIRLFLPKLIPSPKGDSPRQNQNDFEQTQHCSDKPGWLCNLWVPMQKENMVPFVKNY